MALCVRIIVALCACGTTCSCNYGTMRLWHYVFAQLWCYMFAALCIYAIMARKNWIYDSNSQRSGKNKQLRFITHRILISAWQGRCPGFRRASLPTPHARTPRGKSIDGPYASGILPNSHTRAQETNRKDTTAAIAAYTLPYFPASGSL